MKYPLASTSWDKEEIEAINRVVQRGNYSMGIYVSQFENQFADYFKSRYAIMSNSGSSANLLMIASLFFKKEKPLVPGDEIIVPAVSWSTTYMPLQQYGLKVKFVDIDIETLNIDIDKLRDAISEDTRAVLAVNLLGNPNDFESINDILRDKDIYLLEDNCESMGAEFNSRMTGTFGVLGTFSSFFSHHISTMEGGITVTDDEELYHIMLSLRAHGWTRNLPIVNKVTGKKSTDTFSESFKFVLPGYNLRPLEMSGAVGLEQLKKLKAFIHYRRLNAEYFNYLFSDNDNFIIQKEIGKSSWFGFSFIIKRESELKRDEILLKLNKNGIDVRPIVAGNFVKNEAVKYFNYTIHNELINAELVDNHGFFVGNHQYNIKEKIYYLHKILK